MEREKTSRPWLAALAAACMLVWPWANAYGSADSVEVTEITDYRQLAQIASDGWSDEYFAEVAIDTVREEVTVDGEETTFEEVFDVKPFADMPDIASTEAVEDYFEDEVCEAEEVEDGIVQVTNPYQTKQILLMADKLDKDYGASEVFYLDTVGEYILQFDTEEATKEAYEQMQSVYGDACMPNYVFQAEDILMSGAGASSSYSWGAQYMGMDRLKASPLLSRFNRKVTVAVIDTGIDKANFMFKGRTISGQSRNLLENSTYIYDDDANVNSRGHGTHVAGIIADNTPNNVELLILKVFNQKGESTPLALRAALEWAVSSGADVINMSIGTDDVQLGLYMDQYVNEAASRNLVICAAAGNESRDAQVVSPANNLSTITVSALDRDGGFASYSNYGINIDFCAPGTDIVSAARGGTVQSLSGTSMASPHMAAAAAYVKMVEPDANVDRTREILRRFVVDLGAPGKDDLYGYGAVQMARFFDDQKLVDISGYSVTLPGGTSVSYTGKACTPAVQVSGLSDKNYTVSYANNVEPGTATVTVTGRGLYTGTITKTFQIVMGKPSLSAVTNAAKGIQLQWKAVTGATGYQIYRKTGDSGSWKKVKTIGSGSTVKWTDKAPTNGKVYSYRLRAVRNGVESKDGGSKKLCRLDTPKLTGFSNVSGKKAKVKWKKNKKAGGYEIQYGTNKKFSSAKKVKVSVKSTSKTLTKLKKKKIYYVRLRSYKKTGGKTYYSAWSSTKKASIRK